MCGGSTQTDWFQGEPAQPSCASRRLIRNLSNNSAASGYANNTLAGKEVEDDTQMLTEDDRLPYQAAACSEAWDAAVCCIDGCRASHGGCTTATTSSTALSLPHSPSRTSFDSMRPHLACLDMPATLPGRQQQAQRLLLGTSAGLYQLDLDAHACQIQQLALASVPIAHLCYNSSCGLVLAACPVPDEAHYGVDLQARAAAKEAAGLYCLDLKQQQSSCGGSSSFAGGNSIPAMKLWHGGATCCAFGPSQPSCEDEQVVPRIYVGTQPADVIYTDDMGGSFSSCELSEAPQSDSWFRRLPPYEPSVRAINFAGSSVAAAAAAAAGNAVQQQADLMVAVEVGGVMSSPQQECQQEGSSSWSDCSQALCRDVHALQQDPFNPKVMYAVAGSGQLPGGLYRCKGKGQKWRRMFGYRYSVGMALSAYQKGRMLLVSAEKAPATGCILFESVDSGRSWVNISDDVADAAAALTEHAPEVLEQTPLAMFVPGGLVLACASGHVFYGTAKPLGGYSNWKLLATLPAAVTSMCSTDTKVAPVAIQRS